jgi:LacI family transcriptional regulator
VSFDHDAGLHAALDLLDGPHPPTALVCGNDVIAFGALSAARMRGVAVPQELTIIGFDDIPAAAWPLIGLTTVRGDLDAMARTAVDLLLAAMGGVTQQVDVRRIPVRLVERSTHGPAR